MVHGTLLVGSLKMNTALEYSTRVVQEGDRRCKKSTLNDLAYLTPLRIPLMNPVYVGIDYNLTLCTLQSRLQHIYHGQPYARVALSPSQGLWIWPQLWVRADWSYSDTDTV